MCLCLFLSTSRNVLAVFVPDRQIQQFSRGNFNSSAVNILLNNFALLQSFQYWRLKLEIFQKKTGNPRSSQSQHKDWFLFLFDLGIDLEAEAPAFHEKYSKICFLQKCWASKTNKLCWAVLAYITKTSITTSAKRLNQSSKI